MNKFFRFFTTLFLVLSLTAQEVVNIPSLTSLQATSPALLGRKDASGVLRATVAIGSTNGTTLLGWQPSSTAATNAIGYPRVIAAPYGAATGRWVTLPDNSGIPSILKLGAVGDGVSDDTPYLAYAAASGRPWEIPEGYVFKNTTTIVMVLGSAFTGRGTILNTMSNSLAVRMVGNGGWIRGVQFTSPYTNSLATYTTNYWTADSRAISIETDNILLEDVSNKYAGNAVVGTGISNLRIFGLKFDGCRTWIGDGGGLKIRGGSNIAVRDLWGRRSEGGARFYLGGHNILVDNFDAGLFGPPGLTNQLGVATVGGAVVEFSTGSGNGRMENCVARNVIADTCPRAIKTSDNTLSPAEKVSGALFENWTIKNSIAPAGTTERPGEIDGTQTILRGITVMGTTIETAIAFYVTKYCVSCVLQDFDFQNGSFTNRAVYIQNETEGTKLINIKGGYPAGGGSYTIYNDGADFTEFYGFDLNNVGTTAVPTGYVLLASGSEHCILRDGYVRFPNDSSTDPTYGFRLQSANQNVVNNVTFLNGTRTRAVKLDGTSADNVLANSHFFDNSTTNLSITNYVADFDTGTFRNRAYGNTTAGTNQIILDQAPLTNGNSIHGNYWGNVPDSGIVAGAGSPVGAYAAAPSLLWADYVNGVIYIKGSGTSTGGWSRAATRDDTLDLFTPSTSAQLATALSDEAGSAGGFVRATGATLVPASVSLGGVAATTWDEALQGDTMITAQFLGSAMKGGTVGWSLGTGSTYNLVDNNVHFVAVRLPRATTLTGVKFLLSTAGDYTADQNNEIGLYTYSGGTLTRVAVTSNDGNLWKATADTLTSAAFTGTYAASAGIYFIGFVYNNSAQVTGPIIKCLPSTGGGIPALDLTNSAKFAGRTNPANTTPSSQAMSGLTVRNEMPLFILY